MGASGGYRAAYADEQAWARRGADDRSSSGVSGSKPPRRSRCAARSRREARSAPYNGMLSCFFQGFSSVLLRSRRSARLIRRRVECGMITSSM